MQEPATSAFVVTGVIAYALGPVLGPFALLLFGAVAGSLLALSKAPSMSRTEGLGFVAVGVVIALAITGFAVWVVEKLTSIPGNVALMPLAFAISAGRDFLLKIIEKTFNAFGGFLSAWSGKGNDS